MNAQHSAWTGRSAKRHAANMIDTKIWHDMTAQLRLWRGALQFLASGIGRSTASRRVISELSAGGAVERCVLYPRSYITYGSQRAETEGMRMRATQPDSGTVASRRTNKSARKRASARGRKRSDMSMQARSTEPRIHHNRQQQTREYTKKVQFPERKSFVYTAVPHKPIVLLA